MTKKKNNFFVIWDGKVPGIYKTWDECKRQVNGYPDAKYKGFVTEKEATEAYASSCWDYIGKNAIVRKKTTLSSLPPDKRPIYPSISVDAACSGNPGVMEYQGVNTQTGEVIFHQGKFYDATNNIGEFLALVHVLALLKKQNSSLTIYSDSRTAIAWVRKKKASTKLEKTEKNELVFQLITRAENWLQSNSFTNEILKWDTNLWGEIPADFGRK